MPKPIYAKTLFLAALLTCAGVSRGELTVTAGYDYSEGTYGSSSTTTIDYAALSLKYKAKGSNWRYRLTLPWLSIEGDGVIVEGPGGVVDPAAPTSGTDKVRGLGDIICGVTYEFPAIRKHLFDGTLKVKLPTADSDAGLGTGKADFIYQMDYAYAAKPFMPFATLGYKDYGQPQDYSLDAVKFGSIGGQFTLPSGSSFGLSWNYQQAATDSSTDKRDLMGYINYRFNKTWSLTFYGIKGKSESSVDSEAGLSLSVKM